MNEPETPAVVVYLRVPPDIKRGIKAIARRRGLNPQSLWITLAEQAIEADRKEPDQ